ncbi:MAG: polyphenol oxidase family protein [Thermoanaerobaculia bacterium]
MTKSVGAEAVTPPLAASAGSRPETRAGLPGWEDRTTAAEVRFLGRSAAGSSAEAGVRAWIGESRHVARMHQVHGATVLDARPGDCDEADALMTDQPELALTVVTADCVPILLASASRIAAVHAGWRGFVGGVVAAALDRFTDRSEVVAWIGPAIGPCCYEVGEDVALPVVARSSPAVRSIGERGRPHLDLGLAAEIELLRAGVSEVRRLTICTACHPQLLESYRRGKREGRPAGRNLSFIWRRAQPAIQDV